MRNTVKEFENMQVAAIQMVSGTDVAINLETAAKLIASAAGDGAKLILLPEYFCLMGIKDTDKLALQEDFNNGQLQLFLSQQAKLHKVWLVGGTIPINSGCTQRIYNTCLAYNPDGSLVARYDKIHLFGFDNGQEYFSESDTIMPGNNEPQVFDSPAGKVGLSICYDLRFPELYRYMQDVNLILVPSAFTYTTGKAHWEILLRARAIENQCYVLAAAQGGRHESGRRTWGQSILIDPWGRILNQLDTGAGVVGGNISMHTLNKVRKSLPALQHKVL